MAPQTLQHFAAKPGPGVTGRKVTSTAAPWCPIPDCDCLQPLSVSRLHPVTRRAGVTSTQVPTEAILSTEICWPGPRVTEALGRAMLWHLPGLRCQGHMELEKRLSPVQGTSEEGAPWGQSSASLPPPQPFSSSPKLADNTLQNTFPPSSQMRLLQK